MVTSWSVPGKKHWWVVPKSPATCQPVYVAGSYLGSNRSNYHYWWQCRPGGVGDLKITGMSGDVRIGTSPKKTGSWRELKEKDVLGVGTYLWVGPNSCVHWVRDDKSRDEGDLHTSGEAKMLRVTAQAVEAVESTVKAKTKVCPPQACPPNPAKP